MARSPDDSMTRWPDHPMTRSPNHPVRVEARAPARVGLAGGTGDILALYLFHPGAQTVNIAIRCYASCVIGTRPDRRFVVVSQDQEIREEFEDLAAIAGAKS